MAALAAVLPIIEAVGPSLISLITGLVHKAAPVAEQKLGPSTGPVKFADVFGSVMTDLQSAAAAGQIAKQLPSDTTVQVIIQTVVTSMKLTGMLSGAPAVVAVPNYSSLAKEAGSNISVCSQAVTLQAGQTLTVTVK